MKKMNCLSIQREGKTMDLYIKEREGKLNADCQSRSPMPNTSAEPSSSPWGQARPMGAVSHRPHARARQHQTLGKPPGQIPSQHNIITNKQTNRELGEFNTEQLIVDPYIRPTKHQVAST